MPPPAPAFEGEIDATETLSFDTSSTFEWAIEIKGNKARAETRGGFVTITDGDARKSWTLDPAAHTYEESELAIDQTAQIASTAKRAGADTVAGTPCEQWQLDEFGDRTTVCLAAAVRVPFAARAAPSGVRSIERDRLFEKGFPLRIERRTPDGRTTSKMEATRITRRPVADSDFVVPPGYAKGEPMPLHVGAGGAGR